MISISKDWLAKRKQSFWKPEIEETQRELLHKLLLCVCGCLTLMGPFFFLRALLPEQKQNIHINIFVLLIYL